MKKKNSAHDVKSALDAFKGVEKRYNLAVFRVLSIYGPLSHKKMLPKVRRQPKCEGIREGSLYKRLGKLANRGYVYERPPSKGSRDKNYELSDKARLALISKDVTLQGLIDEADEADLKALLAVVSRILSKRNLTK